MITQGIYEHYKSTPENRRLYQVLLLSHNEADMEVLVHYTPLYHDETSDIGTDGITVWTRPLKDFNASVQLDGETVPRFKLISSTIEK